MNFYDSPQWKRRRFQVLSVYGRCCMKCGEDNDPEVDHIKPRSIYPELELDFANLQVLCRPCNKEKSNKTCDDFRPKEVYLHSNGVGCHKVVRRPKALTKAF